MNEPGWSSLELTPPVAGSRALARVQNLRAAGAIATVLLGLLLFWPTTAALMEQWQDTVTRTYTHGFLIVGITLFLLWRASSSWAQVEIRPSIPAFVAVVLASLVWLIAYGASVRIAHQTLLPAIVFGAFAAGYGIAAARRNLVPFGYLYFAVPLWDALIPLLQSASTFAVRILLRVVGIPAYFSGNTFTLPAGSLEIAGGCSGLHFFVVACALAVLYGELHRDPLRVRVKLVALAAVLALLTNWLRIFIIAVAAHLTDMQHSLVTEEHYTFGWYMFVGTVVVFLLIVRRWPVAEEAQSATVDAQPPASGAISWPGIALLLIGLLLAPLWQLVRAQARPEAELPKMFPAAIPGWVARATTGSDWQPVFIGADVVQQAIFTRASHSIEGFSALYGVQRQDKEILRYDNSLHGESLEVRRPASRTNAGSWQEMEVVDRRGTRWLLWYAYRLDDRWHDRPVALQIDYGFRSLLTRPVSAVIAFRTACAGEDCSGARATLREFAKDAWPQSLDAGRSADDAQ